VLSLMSKVDMIVTDVINITVRGRLIVVNDKRRTMNVSENFVFPK
jgi:hypothetical protein